MDAADPLCGISSPSALLPRTIGPAAASTSEAREVLLEAISRARLLKGSEELVEQFKMVLERHGDIRTLYQDDGVKTGAPANGKKDQQGRRPGLDRKRSRFTHKAPERPSVDYSNVLNIKDPHEFVKKMDDLEEAEKEIRRLNGEVVDMELNFDPIVKPRRRSTLPGRKSARFFKLIDDADTQDPVEVPASQTGTMTEFQLSQDDAHASVPENNEQSIPSRSAEGAISDVSEKEDSVAEKDCGDDLTYLLTSLKNLDEPEEEDLLRKTLGIKKIKVDNSIPGVSLRSNTIQKSLMVPPPESPLPRSCQSRISELEKHLFPGDAVNDKFADLQEDDEYEGSPDIVMGEQSMGRDSSNVLITDETFTASVIDKEAPNLGFKAAHHVSDPEPNMPGHADERQAAGSPLGLYAASEYDGETPNLGVKAVEHVLDPGPSMPDHADERQAEGSLPGSYSDTEVAKEKDVCSRSNISLCTDSVAEKDCGDDLTYLLTSLKNLDEPEEEDLLRKTLGIKKIKVDNSIPGVSLRSNTIRKSLMVASPESPLPRSCKSQISELEEHLFPGDAVNDKFADRQEDDEYEGSPDIVMGEQSMGRDSSDVLITNETFTASVIDKEAPNLGFKAAHHVSDPEPNMPCHADERQAAGSPLGLYGASEYDGETPNLSVKAAEHVLDPGPSMPDHADERQAEGSLPGSYSDTEVAKEKDVCSRSNICMEDNVQIDYPIDMLNNETEASSCHLEGSLAEVLVKTPVRNVVSDAPVDNIQHMEVVEEGDVIQDKSSHPSEIPLEDIDPVNQSQMHDGNSKKLAADLENALPLNKEKKLQAAQKGEKKQQSKRSKKVADESNRLLEISQANSDSENRPHMDENIERLAPDLRNAPSLSKEKKLQAAQKGEKKQQSKRSKKVADESNRLLEISQANSDSENRPHMDENIERLAPDLRNAPSLSKEKKLQAAQKGEKKQQSKRSKKVADESNRPLEKSQANSDSGNQPPMDENVEQQTDVTSNAPSPSKAKGQKGAQRRNRTKQLNKRTSLADAGLAWQSGVRKSTRFRTRPLEHWLGERFVYGRIHTSIPTVIGIKTYSPDQDGKKTLKVKSFVPEQYSDLVTESAKS